MHRPPKLLVVPHAGYVYSGDVAALAYGPLARWRERIRRVVLPRILAVEEVAALIAEIGIETEVFAFGSVGPM